MVQLAGFRDHSVFFNDPATYQPPPQQPPPPTPEEQYIQIQGQKMQNDAQNDAAKLELEREKMLRTDDREKDRIESQVELQLAELQAKYNTTIDGAAIRGMMERDREAIRQQAAIAQTQIAKQTLPNA